MDALGRGVARVAAIDHDDAAAGAAEHEGAVQTGGAAADHGDVHEAGRQHVGLFRVDGGGDGSAGGGGAGVGAGVGHHGILPVVDVGIDARPDLPIRHRILRMTQDIGGVDDLVRKRVRALRLAQGWSLDEVASRAHLSASTLSRIETGQRRLALDQLVALSRALDTSLDQLVESEAEDVLISPVRDRGLEALRWPVRSSPDTVVMRRRLTGPPPRDTAGMRAHPGHEWLLVLEGTAILLLGTRRYRVEQDHAAEFSTMLPHAFGAEGRPCDVLMILDHAARRGHEDGPAPATTEA